MKATFTHSSAGMVTPLEIRGLHVVEHDDGRMEIGVDIDGRMACSDELSSRAMEFIDYLTRFMISVREERKARSH